MFQCEKAKKILDVLNAGIENYDFIEMLQARQEVEGLIPMLTVEPHAMRQVQPQAMEEVEALPVEQPQAVEEGPSEEAAASGGARKFLYWGQFFFSKYIIYNHKKTINILYYLSYFKTCLS